MCARVSITFFLVVYWLASFASHRSRPKDLNQNKNKTKNTQKHIGYCVDREQNKIKRQSTKSFHREKLLLQKVSIVTRIRNTNNIDKTFFWPSNQIKSWNALFFSVFFALEWTWCPYYVCRWIQIDSENCLIKMSIDDKRCDKDPASIAKKDDLCQTNREADGGGLSFDNHNFSNNHNI